MYFFSISRFKQDNKSQIKWTKRGLSAIRYAAMALSLLTDGDLPDDDLDDNEVPNVIDVPNVPQPAPDVVPRNTRFETLC